MMPLASRADIKLVAKLVPIWMKILLPEGLSLEGSSVNFAPEECLTVTRHTFPHNCRPNRPVGKNKIATRANYLRWTGMLRRRALRADLFSYVVPELCSRFLAGALAAARLGYRASGAVTDG
jgi:hypothetical protein